ncbi:hypothetical protein [Effusibacillus dendaii]|uniref:Uncharacterized protein n=1 Tax=Effusibacillus dendaii TaxID=2743772 RepID=A0A7I8D9C0_9BACL|nr:hypothetical protein [Effusibacillus dendaii]BCJ86743.1 hypothetical protein skT53_17280 [Effusibacillus dendaii]
MERPTALIRKLLELEIFEEHLLQQMRKLKQQLQQQNISILDRSNQASDIWIQYRSGERVREAVFMRAMLDAEVQGKIRQWTGEKE